MLKRLFLGFCLFMVSASLVQAASNESDLSLITANGDASIKAKPDVAYVRFTAEKTERTAFEAQRQVNIKMNAVLAVLEGQGLAKDKLSTEWLNVYPKYDYKDGSSKLVGYTAHNSIKATVDKLEKIGPIIEAALKAGADQVSGVNFDIKDDNFLKQSVLKTAYDNARSKAAAVAKAAGLSIVKVETINVEGAARPMMLAAPAMAFKADAASVNEATPVIPGEIEVSTNLTVVFGCR